LLANAFAIAEGGPGPFSLDARFGWERRGAPWGAAALGAAIAGSALTIAAARHQSGAEAEDEPLSREREAAEAPGAKA
jgi:hypothetical protein